MSRIVILDDSSELLDVLKYFLVEKGYEVETITQPEDLVSLIVSFSPDIIFLDIFLHGSDGREICKDLRRHEETKYLCILMFSASTKALSEYREYGADGYLEKPFGLNEIIEKIDATLHTCRDFHNQLNNHK